MRHLRLGLDLDGVFCDFTSNWLRIAERIWPGRISPTFIPDQWDLTCAGLSTAEVSTLWEGIKSDENFWKKSPEYPENVRALKNYLQSTISGEEADIFYITSRVPTRGFSVLSQSFFWLNHHDRDLINDNTSIVPVADPMHKLSVMKALDLDGHLDDYLPTAVSLGSKGWLLDRPWNQDERPDGIKVVASVEEFLRKMKNYYEEK